MTDEVPSWFPKSSVRPVSPTARLNYCLGSAAGEAADLHCWLFLFSLSLSPSFFHSHHASVNFLILICLTLRERTLIH